MFVFELDHTDNKSLLRKLAGAMGVAYHGEDFVELQAPAGSGTIKVIDIADELQVLLADVVFFRHLIAKRQPSQKRFYILHFEDIDVNDTATFSVDGETLHKKNTRHSVVRLTSNVFYNTEEVTANTHVKAVKVFFSEAWLKKYLGLGDHVDGLQKYVSLKTACFDMEQLDAEYLKLMNELWGSKKSDPLQNIFLQNRVALLIERFFSRLSVKMNKMEGVAYISESDMQRLMKVEEVLVKKLSEPPPTIDQLSKLVNISATRLKKIFKEMYGSSINQYYQIMRLQKAKELLLSGQHSIKATATATGFSSTAAFTAAFQKQFARLPVELIREL